MQSTADVVAIEREIVIAASPETVWEFFVDEAKVTRWMGTSASLDPRPGGLYQVEVLSGNTARGEFVELDPPHRLVFTWGWESGKAARVAPGSSTIEVELTPSEEGTRLRLTHRDLPGHEAAEAHGHGWDHYLERLRLAASGAELGADPWLEQPPSM
jgi:uncharacterized protein YndB with AHSA1/START domain